MVAFNFLQNYTPALDTPDYIWNSFRYQFHDIHTTCAVQIQGTADQHPGTKPLSTLYITPFSTVLTPVVIGVFIAQWSTPTLPYNTRDFFPTVEHTGVWLACFDSDFLSEFMVAWWKRVRGLYTTPVSLTTCERGGDAYVLSPGHLELLTCYLRYEEPLRI